MDELKKIKEELIDCIKMEFSKGAANVDTKEAGEVIDMIKDICEMDYWEIKKCKYMMEIGLLHMDYDDMEDDGIRGYDNYRYSNGRFAPKGRGTRTGSRGRGRRSRRGYEEYPYMHMMDDEMEDYYDNMRMYGGNNSSRGGNSGNNSGRDMDSNSGRMYTNQRPSRYGYSHEEYMREKREHPAQDEESKKRRMEKLEEHLRDLEDMTKEMVVGMSPEEKQAWKVKLNKLINM